MELTQAIFFPSPSPRERGEGGAKREGRSATGKRPSSAPGSSPGAPSPRRRGEGNGGALVAQGERGSVGCCPRPPSAGLPRRSRLDGRVKPGHEVKERLILPPPCGEGLRVGVALNSPRHPHPKFALRKFRPPHKWEVEKEKGNSTKSHLLRSGMTVRD
jgi:hypothetical protein